MLSPLTLVVLTCEEPVSFPVHDGPWTRRGRRIQSKEEAARACGIVRERGVAAYHAKSRCSIAKTPTLALDLTRRRPQGVARVVRSVHNDWPAPHKIRTSEVRRAPAQ